jgi:hypothetical protein
VVTFKPCPTCGNWGRVTMDPNEAHHANCPLKPRGPTVDERRRELEAELLVLYQKLPLWFRVGWRCWARLNRKRWARRDGA